MTIIKSQKPRRCSVRGCRLPATGGNALLAWCSTDHALALIRDSRAKAAKTEAAQHRQDKERVRPLSWHHARAWEAFGAWVRQRDKGKPCVSCGHVFDGSRQLQAGHYKPAGSNPALRYEPDNVHGQCARPCNLDRSGNLTPYRAELIRRIGQARVDWLEGPHPPRKYTREDLQAIRAQYSASVRALKKQSEAT